MKRSTLKGASALVALLAGLGAGGTAQAASAVAGGDAVARVRQHVEHLKQTRRDLVVARAVARKRETAVHPAAFTEDAAAEQPLPADPVQTAETAAVEGGVEAEPASMMAAEPAAEIAPEASEPGTGTIEAEPAAIVAPEEPSAGDLPVIHIQSEEEAAAAAAERAAALEATRRRAAEEEALRQAAEAEASRQAAEDEAARRQAEADAEQQAAAAASAQVPPQQSAPGVLTRQGVLVVEPSVEYTHTDINRFVFGGVAILDTVLIGAIEATQADRDAITATLGLRYGVTNRIEGELRIPYMYRSDSTTNTFISGANAPQTVGLDDHGLGDIEGAVHWQVNDGGGNWPFVVANFRAKSTTGTGPFDVARNGLGIEEELATGSGFWGFEPSITVIAPSDPAVFFVNLGYLWNVKRSVDKQVSNNRTVTDVDPGDAIRLGVGMGLALNEKVSFSVGYQHDWIMGTKTTFTDAEFDSESLSVGSLSFGVNWQMSDTTALNVSVGVGVTEDAPDVRLMARVPIALDLFK